MTVSEIIYELLNVNLPKTKVHTVPKLKEMHIFNSFCTDQLSNESWIYHSNKIKNWGLIIYNRYFGFIILKKKSGFL